MRRGGRRLPYFLGGKRNYVSIDFVVVFIVCGLDLFSYRVQQKQFMIMLPVKDSYGRRAMSASHNVYFKEVFLKAI